MYMKRTIVYFDGHEYDFDEEEAIYKMEVAIAMVEAGRKNEHGIELGKKFTYANTVSQIVPVLEKVAGGSLWSLVA